MKTNKINVCKKMSCGVLKENGTLEMDPRKYAFLMPGDWMCNPEERQTSIWKDDLLIVDPDATVVDGDVALVRISDKGCTVRRWYNLNDKEVKLTADNPKFRTIIVQKENIELLGKVNHGGHAVKGWNRKKSLRVETLDKVK